MELNHFLGIKQSNTKLEGEKTKLSNDIRWTLEDLANELCKLQETLNAIREGLGLENEEIEAQITFIQDQMDITIYDKTSSGIEKYPVGTFDINAEDKDISDLEQAIWEATSQVLYYAVIRLPEDLQG